MRLQIQHATHYEYATEIQHGVQAYCLTPASSPHQTVVHWQVHAPAPVFASVDGYGNHTHTCSLPPRLRKGTVRAQGVVETFACAELADLPGQPSPWLYLRPTPLAEPHRRVAAFAAPHLDAGLAPDNLIALARAVCEQVSYRPGHTDVQTTALEAFDWGKGVCQDQAHVFIAACRAHRVPARYVSGYFHAPDAPELASHAWVDVCVDIEARRWLSVDVTHACLMDERHVRLAAGPDYAACPPVKGIRHGGGEETMQVHIDIQRL
ncbi:transglutaminase family protein [Aquabacterium sp. A7-Y]|uniref:transglutaminase family protein n=1 Tax=Aquabacterium sp. A7-Y TaxID=1349605 RepID=UPI00223CDEB1|nr:transglutaminase family protein [Aquabacterium sp. A7-Y]MCW7538185.1 transglutaminase family protein [Aquabacterium sp. A7-Y]